MNTLNTITTDEKFAAMKAHDAAFDGRFYVGVKTMKVFCLVSCPAKLPLDKNVVFFDDFETAELSGYRPCKRCKPDQFPDIRPNWPDAALEHLRMTLNRWVTASELAQRFSVDERTVRRHFVAHCGVSPSRMHRKLRLEAAAERIANREPILRVSEDSGFESLSGFMAAFAKEFGQSPGRYRRE